MKILVIHEVSYRKKLVYEYQDYPERLAARGHQVNVLDFDESGDHLHQKLELSRTGLAPVTLENTPYINLPVVKYLSGRRSARRILREKLQRREVDVVLLYSVFINGTSTVRLCRKYGVPVVFRVLDAYHKLRQNPLIELPLLIGEKYIYRNADAVCSTTDKLARYVKQLAGANVTPRLSVIRHGVDTTHFSPGQPDEALRAKLGIQASDPVMLYLGTTYNFAGLVELVRAMPKMKLALPGLKFLVVGGGEADGALRAAVQELGLSNDVILTGVKGYEDLPALLRLAHLCLNPFAINDVTRDIVPIKILQYLACGVPVLSSPLADVQKLFPEESSGVVYASVQPFEGFTDRLMSLLKDRTRLEELGKKGRQLISDQFSIDSQVVKLENLLLSLLDSRDAKEFARNATP